MAWPAKRPLCGSVEKDTSRDVTMVTCGSCRKAVQNGQMRPQLSNAKAKPAE